MQTVVVYGDVMNGIDILGPFSDFEEAINYAEINIKHESWWTTELKNPNKKEYSDIEFEF